jgi:sugar/nucleoside kinase (ribokinase family)
MIFPAIDVVGLGQNAIDTVCVGSRFPRPNVKNRLTNVRLEPGGMVATALTACARLGLSARYIGSVGTDDWGKAQLASLRAENLDLQFVRTVDGATSQMAVIILEDGVGERTILWHYDPKLTYPAEELRREMIVDAKILHLDGCDTAAALQAARWAREAGLPVVIDVDQSYDETTDDLLRSVDYLIAAEDFSTRTLGITDPEEALRTLEAKYACPVTGITLGGRGAIFSDRGKIFRSGAFKVPVADTTGAGDVFRGAFIYGLLQKWALPDVIRFSHATAAMKCMQLGARRGIPTLAQVRDFLEHAEEISDSNISSQILPASDRAD